MCSSDLKDARIAAAAFWARCLGVSFVAVTARAAAAADEDGRGEDVCAGVTEDPSPAAHDVRARAAAAAARATPSRGKSSDLMPLGLRGTCHGSGYAVPAIPDHDIGWRQRSCVASGARVVNEKPASGSG